MLVFQFSRRKIGWKIDCVLIQIKSMDDSIAKKQHNSNEIFSTCTSLIESQLILPLDTFLALHQNILLYRYFRVMREHFYLHVVQEQVLKASNPESKNSMIFRITMQTEERKQQMRRYYPMQHTVKRIKNSIIARIATDKMKPFVFKPKFKELPKPRFPPHTKAKIQTKRSDKHIQSPYQQPVKNTSKKTMQRHIVPKKTKNILADKKSPKRELQSSQQYGMIRYSGTTLHKPLLKHKETFNQGTSKQHTRRNTSDKEAQNNYYLANLKDNKVKSRLGSPQTSSKHSRMSSSSQMLVQCKSKTKLDKYKSSTKVPTHK